MSALAEPNLDDSDDEQIDGQQQMGSALAAEYDDSDSAMEPEEELEEKNSRVVDYSSEAEEEEKAKAESMSTKLIEAMEAATGRQLSQRWRNLLQRGMSGLSLISGFSILVYIGPIGLLFLTFFVMYCCYSEVLRLGFKVCGVSELKPLCHALFVLQQYFLYGQDVLSYLHSDSLMTSLGLSKLFSVLITAHQFISFCGYLLILVLFVLSLDTEYIRSYALFSWCHMFLFLVGVPGRMMNASMLEGGLIFYVLPMTLITLNDIMAYYVGFFCGRTPLIKLSPKKTYEGFFGGGFLTLLFGTLVSVSMASSSFLVCPAEVQSLESSAYALMGSGGSVLFSVPENCVRNPVFVVEQFKFFGFAFSVMPFALHGFIISLICSTVGPFGGFFASGFKRACKRKNFGNLIPGHGGVTDRCDCMFLCAAIIHVYYNAFIKV